jgi:hypothetical protein
MKDITAGGLIPGVVDKVLKEKGCLIIMNNKLFRVHIPP